MTQEEIDIIISALEGAEKVIMDLVEENKAMAKILRDLHEHGEFHSTTIYLESHREDRIYGEDLKQRIERLGIDAEVFGGN